MHVKTLGNVAQQVAPWLILALICAIPVSSSLRSVLFIASLVTIVLDPNNFNALKELPNNRLFWASLSMFFLACLGCLWGDAQISEKMIVVDKYVKFLFFPLLILGFQQPQLRHRGLHAYLVTMLIVTLISTAEWIGILDRYQDDPGHVFHNHIITGIMISYAAYIASWYAWITPGRRRFVYLVLVFLFTVQTFFITSGRTAYVTYIALMGVLFLQILPFKRAFVAVCTALILLGGVYYKSTVMQKALYDVVKDVRDYQVNQKDTHIGYRIQFHKFSHMLFLRHLYRGNGTAGFMHAFAHEKPVPSWDRRLMEPHSEYWLILSEFGLLGILIFSYFLYALLRAIWALNEMRILALGLLVAFALGCMTDSLFLYSSTGVFFMTMVALCLGEQRCARVSSTSESLVDFDITSRHMLRGE